MDNKNEITYIEEQSSQTTDTANVDLLSTDGTVLIPSRLPTQTVSLTLLESAPASWLIYRPRPSELIYLAQMGHSDARVCLWLYSRGLGFRIGPHLPYGQSILSRQRNHDDDKFP